MLLNAAKYQGYKFYRFWVIKEKPTGWVIRVKTINSMMNFRRLDIRDKTYKFRHKIEHICSDVNDFYDCLYSTCVDLQIY